MEMVDKSLPIARLYLERTEVNEMKLTKRGLFAAALVAACGISCLFRVAAAAENDGSGAECVSPTPGLSGENVVTQMPEPGEWIIRSYPADSSTDYVLTGVNTITFEDYVEIDGKYVELLKGSVKVSGDGTLGVTPTPTPVPPAGE